MSSSRKALRDYTVWFLSKGTATTIEQQMFTLSDARGIVAALKAKGTKGWIETTIGGRAVRVQPTWQEQP